MGGKNIKCTKCWLTKLTQEDNFNLATWFKTDANCDKITAHSLR